MDVCHCIVTNTHVCNLQLETALSSCTLSQHPLHLMLTMEERVTVSEFVKKAEEVVRRNHVTHRKYTLIVVKTVGSCQSLSLVFYFSKESSRKHCKKACVIMHQCVWASMARGSLVPSVHGGGKNAWFQPFAHAPNFPRNQGNRVILVFFRVWITHNHVISVFFRVMAICSDSDDEFSLALVLRIIYTS